MTGYESKRAMAQDRMDGMEREELKLELERLADRFSEGWHEGIKIDASDIMLLSEAAQALDQPAQKPVAWLTDADWKEIEDMPDVFDQGVAWCLARLKRKNT